MHKNGLVRLLANEPISLNLFVHIRLAAGYVNPSYFALGRSFSTVFNTSASSPVFPASFF